MYKIYFAGDLFDHKHITGNIALAQYIETVSNNNYKCILPQDWEGTPRNTTIETRNKDIQAIIEADLVLFNFDGTDLDSGTTVEFVLTKMLDIPAVLLRTDCRNGGHFGNEDWNLMALGYPRCQTIKHPALVSYNKIGLQKTHQNIAESIINAFQKMIRERSLLNSFEEIFFAYHYVIKMCGSKLSDLYNQQTLESIITSKIDKEIYTIINSINNHNINQEAYYNKL